jgi:purine-binding chemotaxis protein CheW
MVQPEPLVNHYLICRSDDKLCALPLGHVVETMRALPIEALPAVPEFVLGASIVRDEVMPVVDAATLLGADGKKRKVMATQFVTLKLDAGQQSERHIALAVDAVLGVRALARDTSSDIAPLLTGAQQRLIDAVSVLDSQLLLVLQAAQLISDNVWQRLDESMKQATP